ncbi:peroxiredoxin [Chrysiogenes arsenatis]|uniref:peroxiredoxin n=1 Tax=Chrysiogenes arsenatis TaxID=309797 RepID=UPI0004253A98|nr:peroxiredoxin [Chrysiogenes arsenatis]
MNDALQISDTIPSFELPDQNGEVIPSTYLASQYTVLYFYPKDNTPGCTTEAGDFSALLPEFTTLGVQVYGISPDSVESHKKFSESKELRVSLLSDHDALVAKMFGVWQLKKNYGKEYMGLVRSTFLIAPNGTVVERWSKVRVKGHAEAVLAAVRARVEKK